MKRLVSLAGVIILVGGLSACTATTNISATQGGTNIALKSSQETMTPRTETLKTTSFGNYEFRAQSEGFDPFYGILPLKFNGGYLALDIIFFAPLVFFNLREVYPFYDFDLEKKCVKYRQKEDEEWIIYVPLEKEAERAKRFFTGR